MSELGDGGSMHTPGAPIYSTFNRNHCDNQIYFDNDCEYTSAAYNVMEGESVFQVRGDYITVEHTYYNHPFDGQAAIVDKGPGNQWLNPHYEPSAPPWSSAAQAIINESGLEAAYGYLFDWYIDGTPPPPPSFKATYPNPFDGAADVVLDTDLSWTAGIDAVSHDVYFGTDTTPDAGEFQCDQAGTTFDPGILDYNTTYYWRIDEINDINVIKTGDIWSFTTQAEPPLPSQATNPAPANDVNNVILTPELTWTQGSDADSHDVYFGKDQTIVSTLTRFSGDINGDGWVTFLDLKKLSEQWLQSSAALTTDIYNDGTANLLDFALLSMDWNKASDPAFKGNQTGTTFDPGTLAYDTTYYWRIDEVNAKGTATGAVWSFTTESAPPPPEPATNPNPVDEANDVIRDTNLSWTAGDGADSHDVYFGTDPTPDSNEFQGNQVGTTFDPGILANNTTYYWCIDEVNGSGTTPGTVWSFTTGQSSSVTVYSEADAYTESRDPNTNYGSDTLLKVRSTNKPFIRFDLSGVTDTVSSATLRLYVIRQTAQTVRCHFVSDDSWTESGITYNNEPSLTSLLHDNVSMPAEGTWLELDVTGIVNDEKGTKITFAFSKDATQEPRFSSKEGDYTPELVIISIN